MRGVSSPGFLAAYFLAMQVSRRAHPFLLRSVQCFPARTSSQYRHLERGLFFFGEFFRRRAVVFVLRVASARIGMVLGVSKDDNELARGRLYGILTAYQAAVTRAEVQIIDSASPPTPRVPQVSKSVPRVHFFSVIIPRVRSSPGSQGLIPRLRPGKKSDLKLGLYARGASV